MKHFTKVPDPICWHEGALLTPQHFQQDQRYWHERLLRTQQQLNPYAWGISSLVIDPARLVDGVVSIKQLSANMPDGLLIDYNDQRDEPLTLDINELEVSDNTSLRINLIVPVYVAGGASDKATIQRYDVCDGEPIVDDNTGENPQVLTRLRSKWTLMAGENVSARYTVLPLFEVQKPEGSNFEIGSYIPPLINAGADTFRLATGQTHLSVPQSCQQLALSLRQKSRLLSELTQGDESRLGHEVSERHKLWIRAMIRELPAFELLSDDPLAHPNDLYLSLARIVGAINAISPLSLPPKLPAYDHHNCHSGYSKALDYIYRLLEWVNLDYTSIDFEQNQAGVFSIVFDKAWANRDLLIELIADNENTGDNNQLWLKSCRIATASVHKQLATQRLLGASSTFLQVDDATGLKSTKNTSLFRIKNDPRYIKAGQQLALMSTNTELKSARPAKIRLHLSHAE